MTPHDEITCRELVELVTDYLENTLDAATRARFDTHLGECPGCATYLDQMRETVRLTGTLSEDRFDAAAREDLLAAFRGWKSQSPST
jgi:anti-sigma factor RsiW